MPAGPVIINNTPLVALFTLNKLSLLGEMFGSALIPAAVAEEFLAVEGSRRQSALAAQSALIVTPLSNPRSVLPFVGLDQGEAQVLALAQEQSARLVILDERKARRYAKRLGVSVTGTLGVLLLAKERGLIESIGPLLLSLQEAGLFLHPALIAEVLALAHEE